MSALNVQSFLFIINGNDCKIISHIVIINKYLIRVVLYYRFPKQYEDVKERESQ
jgi:hypothetical protein